ncbi:MAG: glycosyltransferase family 4 protein [Candidatus Binatia bacterium]
MSVPPRRIALVAACPFPSPQGSQVFVGQMAERLAAAGHDVHLLTYGQGAEQVGRGYRHHRIARLPGDDSQRSGPNLVKPLLDAMLARRLVTLVREQAIGILHAHNYEAAVAALAAGAWCRVPVVYHSHNLMGDELETYFESPRARRVAALAGGLLDRSVPRRADRVIALCRWSADRLVAAGCAAEAVHVIPPAVDDDGPLAVNTADRAFFGLGAGDFVVGYVGNLDAYQNLGLLFDAMARLAAPGKGRESREEPGEQAGPRPRLLVASHAIPVGFPGPEVKAALGDGLRVVEVHGPAEARRALSACDAVALPRRLGSGYPVKLLNSMSAAKAVVSAGCGSKVLRDGLDALVVPDDDARALADALEALRRDPARRGRLGEEARRTFLRELTWEQVLPKIEEVYAGLREPAGHPGRRGS